MVDDTGKADFTAAVTTASEAAGTAGGEALGVNLGQSLSTKLKTGAGEILSGLFANQTILARTVRLFDQQLHTAFAPVISSLFLAGDLLTPFSTQIGQALEKVAAVPAIKAASTALGGAIGAIQAEAQALAATGASAISGMASRIAAMSIPLGASGTTVGTAVGGAMSLGMVAGFAGAGIAVLALPMILDKLTGQDPSSKMVAAGSAMADHFAVGYTDEVKATYGAKFQEAMQASLDNRSNWDKLFNNGVEAAGQAGKGAADLWLLTQTRTLNTSPFDLSGLMDHLKQAAVEAGAAAGAATTDALGAGMNSANATHSLLDNINTLKTALEKMLSPRQQAIELIGSDYIKTLTKGMQSEDPNLKKVSQELGIGSIATIEKAGLTGAQGQQGLKDVGVLYDTLLASGMSKAAVDAALVAAGVSADIIAKFNTPQGRADALANGEAIARAWIAGVSSFLRSEAADRAVHDGAANATSSLHGQSPPKTGPLRFIDKWGENVGAAWLGGLSKGVAGLPDLLMGSGPSFALPGAASLASAATGGDFNVGGVSVTVQGGVTNEQTGAAVEGAVLRVMEKVARLRLSQPLDMSGKPA